MDLVGSEFFFFFWKSNECVIIKAKRKQKDYSTTFCPVFVLAVHFHFNIELRGMFSVLTVVSLEKHLHIDGVVKTFSSSAEGTVKCVLYICISRLLITIVNTIRNFECLVCPLFLVFTFSMFLFLLLISVCWFSYLGVFIQSLSGPSPLLPLKPAQLTVSST